MSRHKFWVLLATSLLVRLAEAQVPNDDCLGGMAQGVWMLPSYSNNCDQPGSGYGLVIMDSTDLAIPNFPYPTIPVACAGYTAGVAVGGKDRWYSFRANCDLQFTAQCSDSCHISFWSGADCSSLYPISCYTLLPGQSITGLVSSFGFMPSLDTLSMQISDNGSGADLNYHVCLMNPNPPCISFPITAEPTPVTCFIYDTFVTAASSISSVDGEAMVIMQMGNGPFSVVWNTGDTTFTIGDLSAGWQTFTITDVQGCQATDSILVPIDISVSVPTFFSAGSCGIRYDAVMNGLIYDSDFVPNSVVVMDATGCIVWVNSSPNGRSPIMLPQFAPGLHLVHASGRDGSVCNLKFVTH